MQQDLNPIVTLDSLRALNKNSPDLESFRVLKMRDYGLSMGVGGYFFQEIFPFALNWSKRYGSSGGGWVA